MLGEAARHEGGRFFVANPYELDFILSFSDSFDDRIDSVPDHSEDMRSAPFDERGDQNIRRGLIGFWLGWALSRDVGATLARSAGG
jgi:hypothetical protein